MYYPREVWAGSPFTNARQPKRFVVDDEGEFLDFVKIYNGKMNVYTWGIRKIFTYAFKDY